MERKLATVLFVDLVDSTMLVADADPEVVRRRVSSFFDQVSRCIVTHGGTVEKFAGDAVMAAFGVPLAHEDDAERAVRAGLATLEKVTELYDRYASRVPTGELNRFLGELKEARQPPSKGGRRLNLLYGAQVTSRPPRFRLTVNDPGLPVTSATSGSVPRRADPILPRELSADAHPTDKPYRTAQTASVTAGPTNSMLHTSGVVNVAR